MQVEVPFVPAAARRPKVLETRTEGAIVVVGQTRSKKRKRKDKTVAEQGESKGATAAGTEDRAVSMSEAQGEKEEPAAEIASDEQEDFDLSAVPNILDDDPDNEAQERRTKQKRLKTRDKASRAKGHSFLFTRIITDECFRRLPCRFPCAPQGSE